MQVSLVVGLCLMPGNRKAERSESDDSQDHRSCPDQPSRKYESLDSQNLMNSNQSTFSFEPDYPDVLGAITRGPRINMDMLETAVGIHPKTAYLNQPIEVIILLQNMIDAEIQLRIGVRLPTTDRKGNVVVLETDKGQLSINLKAGEVGVLHMPIVAHPPTQAGKDFPVRVAIRYRAKQGNPIRPPGGGSPPSVLSTSPFKLQVLQEIEFISHKWNESTDILTVYFNLAPKIIPGEHPTLKPRYETLWTAGEMAEEIRLVKLHYDEAVRIARPSPTNTLYLALLDEVEERFASSDMPLHPGEAMAIAKMMAYTVDDAPTKEPDIVIENMRWFRSLCQVLAHTPSLVDEERGELLSKYVFEGILYEAVLIAFQIIKHHVMEDLGSPMEQVTYANRLMKWFAGYGEADLGYVYLPLVLGGTAIARMVRGGYSENPWDLADALEEASNGRKRLATAGSEVIFSMLASLLEGYRRKLRGARIERPDH